MLLEHGAILSNIKVPGNILTSIEIAIKKSHNKISMVP